VNLIIIALAALMSLGAATFTASASSKAPGIAASLTTGAPSATPPPAPVAYDGTIGSGPSEPAH
jgi:hypothetical protein